MDGPNSDTVGSANATYVPSNQLGGDGSSHPGVWCNTSVTSPVNCNTRNKSDWLYPKPTVDFNQVTSSLCTMKKTAFASDPATASLATLSNACSQTPATRTTAYLPQRSSTYNLTRGYLIQLNPNNTFLALELSLLKIMSGLEVTPHLGAVLLLAPAVWRQQAPKPKL
jgi:hypothetical protein